MLLGRGEGEEEIERGGGMEGSGGGSKGVVNVLASLPAAAAAAARMLHFSARLT